MKHSRALYRAVSAVAFLAGLVALDLFLMLLCSGFPLIMYLIVGGVGAWAGGAFHEQLPATGGITTFVRGAGAFLAVLTVAGIVLHVAIPTFWQSHCAWRYCDRALGPGLLTSPYPVSTPDCSAWHTCANEAPFTDGQNTTLLRRMDEQGCAPP